MLYNDEGVLEWRASEIQGKEHLCIVTKSKNLV